MVQNFAVFADRSAAAKINFRSLASAYYGLLVGVVSPEHLCEIKNHKIFSKGWEATLHVKICTSMVLCDEHVDNVLLHTHTHTHTCSVHIGKLSDLFIQVIIVVHGAHFSSP